MSRPASPRAASGPLDSQSIAAGDPSGMAAAIAGLPDQLTRGWALAQAPARAAAEATAGARAGVVICGVGGSAIGADIVQATVHELALPIAIVRGYDPPAWSGPRTLMVAVSYSGGTEETLACVRAAAARGCLPVCITSGGRLAALAAERGWPLVPVAAGLQPRAALGHLLSALLAVLVSAGLAPDQGEAIAEAASLLRRMAGALGPQTPSQDNLAKRLAHTLYGRLPVIYGAGVTVPAARRWKCQLNENAKQAASWGELPEMNHNEVVGYDGDAVLLGRLSVVALDDPSCDERVARRLPPTLDILRGRAATVDVVTAQGSSPFARCLSALYVGDWTSLYLAILNGVDPTPVQIIEDLKRTLAAAPMPAAPVSPPEQPA